MNDSHLMNRRVMLISNSFSHGRGFLQHCLEAIRQFLGSARTVCFVPYAQKDWVRFTETVRSAFDTIGITVIGFHETSIPVDSMRKSEAIFVGGGNTFRLLKTLYDHSLLGIIRDWSDGGFPYVGASAGANVGGPTIKTTNDMPIVWPRSLEALNLVPFQVNPHFIDADPTSKHMGETREKRIAEFHEEDSNDTMVIGMREGSYITVEHGIASLGGTGGAKLFVKGEPVREWDGSQLQLHPTEVSS